MTTCYLILWTAHLPKWKQIAPFNRDKNYLEISKKSIQVRLLIIVENIPIRSKTISIWNISRNKDSFENDVKLRTRHPVYRGWEIYTKSRFPPVSASIQINNEKIDEKRWKREWRWKGTWPQISRAFNYFPRECSQRPIDFRPTVIEPFLSLSLFRPFSHPFKPDHSFVPFYVFFLSLNLLLLVHSLSLSLSLCRFFNPFKSPEEIGFAVWRVC